MPAAPTMTNIEDVVLYLSLAASVGQAFKSPIV